VLLEGVTAFEPDP
jgi:hypothetical protein